MESITKVRTVKSLMRDMKKGSYNLQHSVQRKSQQWSKNEKYKLYDSLLNNIVLFPIVFCKQEEEIFVIDGKQRLETLDELINSDKFKEEFDEEQQDIILSSEVSTITYINCTDEEIFTLFERYNSGVSLSGSQKARSYASIEILSKVKEALEHPFFRLCNITKGQIKKSEDEIVVLEAIMLLSGFEYKNFSFKEINRFLQEYKDLNDEFVTLNKNMDILYKIIETPNKNLKKLHLPFILANAREDEQFATGLINFLNDYDNQEEYRSFCQGGTSQKQSVEFRNNFFKNL